MASPLAEAHIEAQTRLRTIVSEGVGRAWAALPGYDEDQVELFLSQAVPLVAAGRRNSTALTEAFLARAIGRPPLGIEPPEIRNGAPAEEVYRRPFVTVWSALQHGTPWEEAVASGLERATSTAATDVQLSMRGTLREVGNEDDLILGYQRVPDGGACDFCVLVAGQRYTTDDLLPIHNRCGCGVDVITGEQRPDFTGRYDKDPVVARSDDLAVAVREHGELGPVLTDAAHVFTSEARALG